MAVCLRGERDRDRVVVRCLLAVGLSVNVLKHMRMTAKVMTLGELTIWHESCGAYA